MIPSFSVKTTQMARFVAGGIAAAALLLAPDQAHAQQAQAQSVTPDGKAIVGCALLGAEVVNLTMGIAGVEAGWPYLVFGAVGAGAGSVGGYFIEQETRDVPEVSLYLLAGGMALVIPTIVVSLNATMYKAPEGTITTTEPADNQPATGPTPVLPAQPQTRRLLPRPAPRTPPAQRFSFSLVGMHEGSLALSLPAVEVRPLYSRREMWTYGVEQGTEVRLPLFSTTF